MLQIADHNSIETTGIPMYISQSRGNLHSRKMKCSARFILGSLWLASLDDASIVSFGLVGTTNVRRKNRILVTRLDRYQTSLHPLGLWSATAGLLCTMTSSDEQSTGMSQQSTHQHHHKLPPPILSLTPGTWSYDTMKRRINQEILYRTYQENRPVWESDVQWEPVLHRFDALRAELQNPSTTKLSHLNPLIPTRFQHDSLSQYHYETRVVEYQQWYDLLQPYVLAGDTWLSAPWMITEFYVYRRLMQVLDYWNPESIGFQYDPFHVSKEAGLISSLASAEALLQRFSTLLDGASVHNEGLALAISAALWGNKMDLSLWPADVKLENTDIFTAVLHAASENCLHNDEEQVTVICSTLRERGGGNIDIIVDNAGFELITDLSLAQHLVESGIAKTVTFQLKSHPTFVSDAMTKDLIRHVSYYQNEVNATKYPFAVQAGRQWQQYLDDGTWVCNEDNFWVQPLAMWDMPDLMRLDFGKRCDLVFVKGDANYRRLLGDRMWDLSTPFQDVVGSYFPCPVCALRTLKAELGCGMAPEEIARAKKLDDQWMVNGRFGVVHFGTGLKSNSKSY
jgi:hypothetical protein